MIQRKARPRPMVEASAAPHRIALPQRVKAATENLRNIAASRLRKKRSGGGY